MAMRKISGRGRVLVKGNDYGLLGEIRIMVGLLILDHLVETVTWMNLELKKSCQFVI